MKIGILFVFAVIAMFLMPMAVFAEEDTTASDDELITIAAEDNAEPSLISEQVEEDVDPGTTPDSPFYGLDVAMDKLKLKLTGNVEKRAEIRLNIAKERLAEMKKMAEENKDKEMEKAKEKHAEVLEGMEKDMSEIEDKDKLIGIENGMANHIAAMEKVRAKIEANENISNETKAKLLEKIDNQIVNAGLLTEKIKERREERANKSAGTEEVETEESNLECEKSTYSTCPEGCVKTCIPSACSEEGMCTADCDGSGSCAAETSGEAEQTTGS